MPNWVSWLGWLFTLIVGGIAFIQELKRKATREAHEGHIKATLEQLATIRDRLTEARRKGRVFKTDADQELIIDICSHISTAENHLSTVLGLKAEEPPESKQEHGGQLGEPSDSN